MWKPSQPYGKGDLKGCRLASSLTFKMHRRQLLSFSAGISHLKCGEGTKKWLITMWKGSRKGFRRAPGCSGFLFPPSDLHCSSRSILHSVFPYWCVFCFPRIQEASFVYSHAGTDMMIFLKINITYQVFKIFLCKLLCSSQIFVFAPLAVRLCKIYACVHFLDFLNRNIQIKSCKILLTLGLCVCARKTLIKIVSPLVDQSKPKPKASYMWD